jgi:predicted membrane protein
MRSYRRSYTGGLIILIVGILLLLNNLDILNFGDAIATYWPLIIIIVGVNILFRHRSFPSAASDDNASNAFSSSSTQKATGSVVNNSSVFGDVDLRVDSTDFRGGKISNTFGDMNIDLSGVQLADGEYSLAISGVFGDVHVLIPKNIEISVMARTVFGDVRVLGNTKTGIGQEITYLSENYSAANKKLKLFCNQVFGDVRVW